MGVSVGGAGVRVGNGVGAEQDESDANNTMPQAANGIRRRAMSRILNENPPFPLTLAGMSEAYRWKPGVATAPLCYRSIDRSVLQKVIAQATFTSMGGSADVEWPWLMAAALLSTLPVLLLFIFCQRFFIAGLTGGAVKG